MKSMEDYSKKSMEFVKTPIEFFKIKELNITDCIVLSVYKYFTEEGYYHCCTLTNEQICDVLNICLKTLADAKRKLTRLGFIERKGIKVRYLGVGNIVEVTTPNIANIVEVTTPNIANIAEVATPNIVEVTTPNIVEVTTPNIANIVEVTTPNIVEVTTPNIEEVTTPNIVEVTTHKEEKEKEKEKKEEYKEEYKEEKNGPGPGPGPIEDNNNNEMKDNKETPKTNFDKIISYLPSYYRKEEHINYIKDNLSAKIDCINKLKDDELNISLYTQQIKEYINKQFGPEEYVEEEKPHRDKRDGQTQLEDQFNAGFCYMGEDAFDSISKGITAPKETMDDRYM